MNVLKLKIYGFQRNKNIDEFIIKCRAADVFVGLLSIDVTFRLYNLA